MNSVIKQLPSDYYKCLLYDDEIEVCKCMIGVEDHNKWQITGWYTRDEYKNKGYGKQTMKCLLDYLYKLKGMPEEIDYIWNGTNKYVYDFIKEKFDARCSCPIVVQKYQADDDWDSHIYILDTQKVFSFFHVK